MLAAAWAHRTCLGGVMKQPLPIFSPLLQERYYVLYVRPNRIHRRKFDPKGNEIEPNFSDTRKVTTGFLMSSYSRCPLVSGTLTTPLAPCGQLESWCLAPESLPPLAAPSPHWPTLVQADPRPLTPTGPYSTSELSADLALGSKSLHAEPSTGPQQPLCYCQSPSWASGSSLGWSVLLA